MEFTAPHETSVVTVANSANRELKRELGERIRLCQRLLRRPAPHVDELLGRSVEELREQAERLEREVTQTIGPA